MTPRKSLRKLSRFTSTSVCIIYGTTIERASLRTSRPLTNLDHTATFLWLPLLTILFLHYNCAWLPIPHSFMADYII